MTDSPLVQRANKITGWLMVGFVVTFVAALVFKGAGPVADQVNSAIEVDAGGEPLGIPQNVSCPCGEKMRFMRDDFDRPLYRCPDCRRTREIPVQR